MSIEKPSASRIPDENRLPLQIEAQEHIAERGKSLKPDFGTAGTASSEAQQYGNMFGNSRYSTNILITDTPDERGQRVFFIDTGVNADERGSKSRRIVERQAMGRVREFNFNQ